MKPTTLIAFAIFCCSLAPVGAEERPNILFLAVDDMKDWVNCLGGYEGVVHTPHIDRLARQGMLFKNAHCASPKCAPSRAALMTGLMPSTTGLYDNGHWWLPNLPEIVTIPMQFRQHGYRAHGAGKIFHHTAGNHPPNQWDDFQRITFQSDPWFRGAKRNYPWSSPVPFPNEYPYSGVSGLGHENDWGALPIRDRDYDDALSTAYAVRFLKDARVGDPPFFLACGIFRPHLPWYVPQRYFDMYSLEEIVLPEIPANDLDDLPSEAIRLAADRRSDFNRIRKASRHRQAIRAYLASISYADAQLGEILDALADSPHAENTIVVLWSDHGWHLGEKQHWHKSTLWEESTHVPLVIRVPGMKSGTCSRPVSLLDLFPTLNDLAGLPAIAAHEGRSLKPLLEDPEREWEWPAVIEFRRGNAAVRTERYRYIRYSDGGEELYDHSRDSGEWDNLAGDPSFAEIMTELGRWLPQQWAPAAPVKGAFEFDPEEFTWKNKSTGRTISGR